MKESDTEGLANHSGSESCGGGGNIAAEALTGVRVGTVLSPEIALNVPGADHLLMSGRHHVAHRSGKRRNGPAGSETRCMRARNPYGSRESLCPASGDCPEVRTVNSKETRP